MFYFPNQGKLESKWNTFFCWVFLACSKSQLLNGSFFFLFNWIGGWTKKNITQTKWRERMFFSFLCILRHLMVFWLWWFFICYSSPPWIYLLLLYKWKKHFIVIFLPQLTFVICPMQNIINYDYINFNHGRSLSKVLRNWFRIMNEFRYKFRVVYFKIQPYTRK